MKNIGIDISTKKSMSMLKLISFHAVFTMCVIEYARCVSSSQGVRNSDTYLFEALLQCIKRDFGFNCNL